MGSTFNNDIGSSSLAGADSSSLARDCDDSPTSGTLANLLFGVILLQHRNKRVVSIIK